ncbi:MAG: hypothetical protein EPN88_13425 [Bacteroidetes bacterium]|nr:MAG: hypothetical protein EPN88_13425 [Bacteroidota bacterium]
MRPEFKLVISFFIFIILLTDAIAINISPGKTAIDAEPGLTTEIKYTASNPSVDRDSTVILSKAKTDDALMKYVTFEGGTEEENPKLFIPKGGSANFVVKINLPQKLPENMTPGEHKLYIGINEDVSELPPGSVVALTNIYSLLLVRVPYPGIYADILFGISDINYGQSLPMSVVFTSRGTDVVKSVTASAVVYSENKSLISLPMRREQNLQPTETRPLSWELEPNTLPPGDYRATAHIEYDGQTKDLATTFRVGSEDLDITNTTTTVESGGIRRYDLDIVSKWNNQLKNIYADIKIIDNGTVIQKTKTPYLEALEPWNEGRLSGFLDTTEIKPGTYDSEITIYYGHKSKVVTTELTVTPGQGVAEKPSDFISSPFLTLVIFGALLIIILIGTNLYLLLKKHTDEKT